MKLAWLGAVAIGLCGGPALAGTDASFVAGTWSGAGTLQMQDKITPCPVVSMSFAAGPGSYSFAGSTMTCGGATSVDHAHPPYDVRADGQIYYKGVLVGAVGQDRIHIDNPVAVGNGMSDDYSIVRRGDVVVFSEIMGAPGKAPWFSFVAILRGEGRK